MLAVVDAGKSEDCEVSPTVVEALWDDESDGMVANASDIVELLFLRYYVRLRIMHGG
jgi:hypothetical protein